MSRSARVSFGMIVRNGAATLAECLRSVAPLCEESIVVDTGSTDGSPDIARSLGATVLRIPWPDDFAAARNVYLEQARCPWVLSLDADEVLGGVDRDSFFSALETHPTTAFLLPIRHYFADGDVPEPVLPSRLHRESPGGVPYMSTRIVRLFPRVPGIRYCYPVHESVVPAARRAGLSLGQCAIPIRHSGYLTIRQDSPAKFALYRALGEKKIREFPSYFLGYVELGKVCLHAGELDRAAGLFQEALRLAPRCVEAHYFLALVLLRQQRHAECAHLLRAACRRFPLNGDIRHLASRFEQQAVNR